MGFAHKIGIVWVLGLALAGCNLNPEPTLDASTIFTQAASTVDARLTADAGTQVALATESTDLEATRLAYAVETLSARQTQQAPSATALPALAPTEGPAPEPTSLIPTAIPAGPVATPLPADCNRADFLGDLYPVSNNVYYPGEVFRVSWRFQNVGSCTWTPQYSLAMIGGEFQGNTSVPIASYVRPGQTIDITFPLVTPNRPGSFIGYWNFLTPDGQFFGTGPDSEVPLIIQVFVLDTTRGPTYDFASNMCSAEWRSGRGYVPCLQTNEEGFGLVLLLNYPDTEAGIVAGPAIWAHPNESNTGWINGAYPRILIRSGDRFKSQIGCLSDSSDCAVIMQVEYETADGMVWTLGQWYETSNGRLTTIDQDISYLAGQTVRFIFTVTVQNNQPLEANAVWIYPRIEP